MDAALKASVVTEASAISTPETSAPLPLESSVTVSLVMLNHSSSQETPAVQPTGGSEEVLDIPDNLVTQDIAADVMKAAIGVQTDEAGAENRHITVQTDEIISEDKDEASTVELSTLRALLKTEIEGNFIVKTISQ